MKLNNADKLKAREIAAESGRTYEEVIRIIKSPYVFMRGTISNLDIKRDLDRSEFEKLKTNFNIPSIGKLYASYYIYKSINKHGKEKSTKKE